MRLVLTFSIWLISLTSSAFAQGVSSALAPDEVLSATFRQERHLQGIDSVAKSSGDFFLVPGKGVLWATQKPLESTLIVSRNGIKQVTKGKKTLRIPARRMPGISSLQSVFETIARDDWAALEQDYGIQRRFFGARWVLDLKLASSSGSEIQRISLSGKTYVETIKIVRDNGDWDQIYLTNHATRNVEHMNSVVRMFK